MCDVHVALNCTMCIVVHGLAGAVTALSCEGHTSHTINPTLVVGVYIVPSTFFLFFIALKLKSFL